MATRTYYEILGVPYNAGASQIKSAYLKLKAKYNSDLFPSNSKQAKRFRHIRAAKRTLLHPEKRKRYDYLLFQEGILDVIPDWEIEPKSGSSAAMEPPTSSLGDGSAGGSGMEPSGISDSDDWTDFDWSNNADRWKYLDDDREDHDAEDHDAEDHDAEDERPHTNPHSPPPMHQKFSPPPPLVERPPAPTGAPPIFSGSAKRRKRGKQKTSTVMLLIQLLMLPLGGVAGISVAILILWLGFQYDPFNLFNPHDSKSSQPSPQGNSQPDAKTSSTDGHGTAPRSAKRETEKRPNKPTDTAPTPRSPIEQNPQTENKINPAPGPALSRAPRNEPRENNRGLPRNNSWTLLFAGLDKAGQACEKFDWWPSNQDEAAQLQKFVDQLVAIQQGIIKKPEDDPELSFLVRQRDRWAGEFIGNFQPPDGGFWNTETPDTETDLNRQFESKLRSGNGMFIAFGMLLADPAEEPGRPSGQVRFKIIGTKVQIETERAKNWNSIDPGLNYLLVGQLEPFSQPADDNAGNDPVQASEVSPVVSRRARIEFISLAGSYRFDPQFRATPAQPVQFDEAKIAKERATLEEVYGTRRKELEQTPWDFKEVANFTAKQNKMVDLHREIYDLSNEATEPTQRYVIIRYALELAIEAGNSPDSIKYIEQLRQDYQIDDLPLQIQAVIAWDKMVKYLVGHYRAKRRDELEALVTQYANRAYNDRRFDEAAVLFKLAYNLTTTLEPRRKKLNEMYRHSKNLATKHERMMALRNSLGDPKKRLQWGKYWCFEVGDWPRGLPYLANSSDSKIIPVAQRDLKGAQTREERRSIADDWYELSRELNGMDQEGAGQRALSLYGDLQREYTGIDLKFLEDRIAELKDRGVSGPVETSRDGSDNPAGPDQ